MSDNWRPTPEEMEVLRQAKRILGPQPATSGGEFIKAPGWATGACGTAYLALEQIIQRGSHTHEFKCSCGETRAPYE